MLFVLLSLILSSGLLLLAGCLSWMLISFFLRLSSLLWLMFAILIILLLPRFGRIGCPRSLLGCMRSFASRLGGFKGCPRRTADHQKGDPGVSLVSGLVGPWF